MVKFYMDSKYAYDARSNFADRLHAALAAAGQPVSPTAFARAYNLRADGAAVTLHGARKWLKGEAFPTQGKLLVLARWLNVNATWLRFGGAEDSDYSQAALIEDRLSSRNLILIHDVMSLSAPLQNVVRELVDAFMRMAGEGSEALSERQPERRAQQPKR